MVQNKKRTYLLRPVPTRLRRYYDVGWTTKARTGRTVAVKVRLRRRIGYGEIVSSFEHAG